MYFQLCEVKITTVKKFLYEHTEVRKDKQEEGLVFETLLMSTSQSCAYLAPILFQMLYIRNSSYFMFKNVWGKNLVCDTK